MFLICKVSEFRLKQEICKSLFNYNFNMADREVQRDAACERVVGMYIIRYSLFNIIPIIHFMDCPVGWYSQISIFAEIREVHRIFPILKDTTKTEGKHYILRYIIYIIGIFGFVGSFSALVTLK